MRGNPLGTVLQAETLRSWILQAIIRLRIWSRNWVCSFMGDWDADGPRIHFKIFKL